jgi:hypothetical protein
MYARFAWGLRGFLHETITLEEARAIVRRRLAERDANFLRLVEKGVFGYPRSPYLPLLRLARVELGDIQDMVQRRGLEDTLRALRKAGVYVTFEEFKGREPIVRDGQVIPAQAQDFDNPYLQPHYYRTSGGSTGAGTRISTDLAHLAAQAPHMMLAHEAHGILGKPLALWAGVLPDGSGINNILHHARFGEMVDRWFSPVLAQDLRPALRYRIANRYFLLMARIHGAAVPQPELLPLDKAAPVAHWAARMVQDHDACCILTLPSRALRVCLAAKEQGLDLTGAAFWVGGEPVTSAKVRGIAEVGARTISGYWMAEAGIVGQGCAQPADTNDIHLFRDALVVIQFPQRVPGTEITVDAFNFTSLLPSAPKLMLNVVCDDYGVIEKRACGCLLETCGFTEHVRHIYSYRKLTGEGVTLIGSEMIYILEEVLPARFGGSPLDYQLVEEEDKQGFTRLVLVISPNIELTNEVAVTEAVLEAMAQSSTAADAARAIWSQAEALQVRRQEPIRTARGKLMPLRLAQRIEPTLQSTGGGE